MFRIQPGVEISDPDAIWQTFENVKFALNPALLVFESTLTVDSVVALGELAFPVKVPFFMNEVDASTSKMWERGSLSVEFSAYAQDTDFVGHVMGVTAGGAAVDLLSLSCSIPAGAKLYHRFTASLPMLDLRPYDGIVVAHEVPVAPVAADRYVITTQLTFRPFAPFGKP